MTPASDSPDSCAPCAELRALLVAAVWIATHTTALTFCDGREQRRRAERDRRIGELTSGGWWPAGRHKLT